MRTFCILLANYGLPIHIQKIFRIFNNVFMYRSLTNSVVWSNFQFSKVFYDFFFDSLKYKIWDKRRVAHLWKKVLDNYGSLIGTTWKLKYIKYSKCCPSSLISLTLFSKNFLTLCSILGEIFWNAFPTLRSMFSGVERGVL